MIGAKLPTAVHADGPLHDTAFREVPGTIDQVDPFHDSIPKFPTAMHADGLLHETPLYSVPAGGPGTIDHAEPFHNSFSVPTAAQNVELVQDTLSIPPLAGHLE